jgi:hypothetical protein
MERWETEGVCGWESREGAVLSGVNPAYIPCDLRGAQRRKSLERMERVGPEIPSRGRLDHVEDR